MIKRGTEEWQNFIKKLNFSRSKSNRDVLCLKCWKVMKYEESVKHKGMYPTHKSSVMTSKQYASEDKFIELAIIHGKSFAKAFNLHNFSDGNINSEIQTSPDEYYMNPYLGANKRGRPRKTLNAKPLHNNSNENIVRPDYQLSRDETLNQILTKYTSGPVLPLLPLDNQQQSLQGTSQTFPPVINKRFFEDQQLYDQMREAIFNLDEKVKQLECQLQQYYKNPQKITPNDEETINHNLQSDSSLSQTKLNFQSLSLVMKQQMIVLPGHVHPPQQLSSTSKQQNDDQINNKFICSIKLINPYGVSIPKFQTTKVMNIMPEQ
eukprot:403342096